MHSVHILTRDGEFRGLTFASGGVCAGVDCNNLGTCLSVTEGSQLIPRCACNSGTVRPNDTSCAEASSVTPPPGSMYFIFGIHTTGLVRIPKATVSIISLKPYPMRRN